MFADSSTLNSFATVLGIVLGGLHRIDATDCNRNGIDDSMDVASRSLGFRPFVPSFAGEYDLDGDGLLDGVRRAEGALEILFNNGDGNDGAIDISDGISIMNFLFTGGPAPAPPGPPGEECGVDPDEPGSAEDLSCAAADGQC